MRALTLPTVLLAGTLSAQTPYFPPVAGPNWETVDPAALGWCTDAIPPLLELLESNDTKAFILLKDGRIAMEHYFGTFTADSLWYWASAGKSLTAFLVGMAKADGVLQLDAPTSQYLGTGWSSLTPEQEAAITVRHQLTMTTGLDDSGDVDCTDPACLTFLAAPGTRWAYHNAPYTLLDGVIENATGQGLNQFLLTRITPVTGIAGLYLPVGYNNVFFSRARAAARFGLLAMHQGVWNGTPVLNDPDYFSSMISPSQPLNPAYGYLWWLNRPDGYMVPGLQFLLPGAFMPHAPLYTHHAMGRNGQFINVVPDQGLVLVRLGSAPGDGAMVPFLFNDAIWEKLNAVICAPTGIDAAEVPALHVYTDPAGDLVVTGADAAGTLTLHDAMGRTLLRTPTPHGTARLHVHALAPGTYLVRLHGPAGVQVARWVKDTR
jgi:CubicO group peptidase (beta-lactamase class C family)